MVQGVQIIPNDIDILTDKKGFYLFRDIFSCNIHMEFKYSKLKKSRSFFGSLKINGVIIEVMAELENKFNDEWEFHQGLTQKKIIPYSNIRIPVIPLSYEKYICDQLKRKEKAILIENVINTIAKSANVNDIKSGKTSLTNRSSGFGFAPLRSAKPNR